jgi:large subunit ribosomal protein L21
MYAVIRTGGKQYRVQENQLVKVEKLEAGVGAEVRLDEVLMVGGDEGIQVGTPTVAGAVVLTEVVSHGKGRKISGFTFKAKKNQRRRYGHRQQFTELRVQSINVGGEARRRKPAAAAAPAAEEAPAVEEAPAAEE